MSKRRLSVRTRTDIGRASRAGYVTFRYGSTRPVSLARIFTGEARRDRVGKVISILRDWRLSPFEKEGPSRAGLRSGLCLEGYGWHRADMEADALVGEALHLIGATRPTWAAGQPEYVIGRENCANCRGPLDDEALARRDRFCCDECRTTMRTYRNDRFHYAAAEAAKWAYQVACKEAAPERPCGWCGTLFRSMRPDVVTCSTEHAAKLREQNAGRAIPDRRCKNPACGKVFHPENRRVEYCSAACHREHQGAILEPRQCEHEPCGKTFQPRFAFEKFCSAACRKADLKGRTLPPKACAHCGTEFAPKKASNLFCGRTCASRARVAKASAFKCEECFPVAYLEAAE